MVPFHTAFMANPPLFLPLTSVLLLSFLPSLLSL